MSLNREKLAQAAELVAASEADVWLTFVRETAGHADPVLPFLVDGGLTWDSALMVGADGRKIAVVGNYDADPLDASGDWDQVVPYVRGIRDSLLAALAILIPAGVTSPRIAVNYSEDDDKADGLTHGMYRRLERLLEGTRYAGSLVSAEAIVAALRGRKVPTEIERIQGAIAETDRLFEEIGDEFARIGTTELEIWRKVQSRIDARGLGYSWERAGNPIVNCGPASMVGHGKPSPVLPLAAGQILHVDLGVLRDGYGSDLQRCWFLGDQVPEAVTHAFQAVYDAISAGAEALRPGVAGWEVDAAARQVVTAAGYPEYLHALGHQVGRMAHDGGGLLGPRWERYGHLPEMRVEAGQVYTLELGVMVEGAGYLGIEEMVVVTETGCAFLSTRQDAVWPLPVR